MRGPATKTTSSAHLLPLQCKMTTARQMQTFSVSSIGHIHAKTLLYTTNGKLRSTSSSFWKVLTLSKLYSHLMKTE